MLPPTNIAYQTRTVNGRTYTGQPGQALDVPDFDAAGLTANGWIDVGLSGPTSTRPVGQAGLYRAIEGVKFFDSTLGYVVVFDGQSWRNPATGNAV